MAGARTMRLKSLRAKFLGGTLLVIALVMAAVLVVVDHRQRAAIIEEVQRRGEVIARNLAAISYGPLLLYNYTALEQNVARVAGEADVVYALVLDADGRVAAHSRDPERVGAVLEGLVHRRAALASELLVQETVTSQGAAIYDFAVPVQVEGRKWGTIRVGLSKQRMEAEIGKSRLEPGARTLVELRTGFFKGEVAGRYGSEAFADPPELSDILMETLVSRTAIPNVPLTLGRRNGSTVPIELRTAPRTGGEGKDLGVSGVFRDLT